MRRILHLLSFLALMLPVWTFAQSPCPQGSDSRIHTVQKGETYYRISKMYNISLDDLYRWNGVSENVILNACQKLWVRSPNSAPTTTTTTTSTTSYSPSSGNYTGRVRLGESHRQSGGTHTVVEGETVENLAELYGYTESRFREFNGLGSTAVVIGQVVKTSDCNCPPSGTTTESTGQGSKKTSPFFNPKPKVEPKPNPEPIPAEPPVVVENDKPAPTKSDVKGEPVEGPAYLSNDERLMIQEINAVRTNPRAYIPHVQAYIDQMTTEGAWGNSIETAHELISVLQAMEPVNALEPAECLYQAAKAHGEDQQSRGYIDHMGSDKSWPWDRVTKACPSMSDGNENLVGGAEDVRESVIILLVDDGIPNRGHRKTMLRSDWKYLSCHKVGKIGTMDHCWVQKFGK